MIIAFVTRQWLFAALRQPPRVSLFAPAANDGDKTSLHDTFRGERRERTVLRKGRAARKSCGVGVVSQQSARLPRMKMDLREQEGDDGGGFTMQRVLATDQ